MRSGCSASATGASESLASVRAGADSAPSASSEASGAGRREHRLPQARDSVRPAPRRFRAPGPRLQARRPRGLFERLGEAATPFRPLRGRLRRVAPCAQARHRFDRPRGAFGWPDLGLKLARRPQRVRLRLHSGTQRRPRSPRPARQSRDSPKIRDDGRTSARRTARSAGADQAPGAATRE